MKLKIRYTLFLNYNQVKKISLESIWILIGQFTSVLGTFFLIRVLTQRLPPEQYGKIALCLTVSGFINQVFLGGVIAGISRFLPIASEKNEIKSYLSVSVKIIVQFFIIIVLLSFLITLYLFYNNLRQYIYLFLLTVSFSLLSSVNNILTAIHNSARQRSIVALHSASDSWLKVVSIIVIYKILNDINEEIIILSYSMSVLGVIISQVYFSKKYFRNKYSKSNITSDYNWEENILKYSLPFCLWGIFTWMQQSSDRWSLENFASSTEVGKYSVLFQVGYAPINILVGLLMTLIGPIFFSMTGDGKDYEKNNNVKLIAKKLMVISLVITFLGFIICYFLHEKIFYYLVSDEYRANSHFLPWVVTSGGIFATAQLLSLKLMSDFNSNRLLIVKIVTAILGVFTNILGSYYWGLNGLIISLNIFSILYFIWMSILTFDDSFQNNRHIVKA